jgi:hypothetical protein
VKNLQYFTDLVVGQNGITNYIHLLDSGHIVDYVFLFFYFNYVFLPASVGKVGISFCNYKTFRGLLSTEHLKYIRTLEIQ